MTVKKTNFLSLLKERQYLIIAQKRKKLRLLFSMCCEYGFVMKHESVAIVFVFFFFFCIS